MKKALSLAASALLAASPALADNPGLTHNDYVTLSGKVGKVLNADEFELNYGTGTIKVDTNDTWPELFTKDKAKSSSHMIRTGDPVTVTGRVDKNWMTANEIEAEMVSFNNGSYNVTYRNPKNQTWLQRNMGFFNDGGRMSLSGTVAEVKNDHEFVLRYGSGSTIQVDTDPLDIPNDRMLRVGENVTVYGTFDKGIFERNEIQAQAMDRTDFYSSAN